MQNGYEIGARFEGPENENNGDLVMILHTELSHTKISQCFQDTGQFLDTFIRHWGGNIIQGCHNLSKKARLNDIHFFLD